MDTSSQAAEKQRGGQTVKSMKPSKWFLELANKEDTTDPGGRIEHKHAPPRGPNRSAGGFTVCPTLLNDAVAESFGNSFGLGVHVQLIVDAANVIADGVRGDVELSGRVLIAVALGQQPQ